ncbi:hypothetical protein [Paenibacillus caui]|uniref:hypothetical protein n=1 Tax=Paenibacillus caui TaxID=2873927 RepID=UPI001CA82211|nr:hypothetical protein [Paenibacillus caui]
MSNQRELAYQSVYDLEISLFKSFHVLNSFLLEGLQVLSNPADRFKLRAQYLTALRSILENFKLLSRKLILYSRVFGFGTEDRKKFEANHRKNSTIIKRRIKYLENAAKGWSQKQRNELQYLAQILNQTLMDKENLYKVL